MLPPFPPSPESKKLILSKFILLNWWHLFAQKITLQNPIHLRQVTCNAIDKLQAPTCAFVTTNVQKSELHAFPNRCKLVSLGKGLCFSWCFPLANIPTNCPTGREVHHRRAASCIRRHEQGTVSQQQVSWANELALGWYIFFCADTRSLCTEP